MKTNATKLIDDLGLIKAQIAELTKQESALKAAIVAMGEGAHDGDLFRATVSTSERETLDMAAVRDKLSPQFVAAHTKVSTVTCVKVVARVKAAPVSKDMLERVMFGA